MVQLDRAFLDKLLFYLCGTVGLFDVFFVETSPKSNAYFTHGSWSQSCDLDASKSTSWFIVAVVGSVGWNIIHKFILFYIW